MLFNSYTFLIFFAVTLVAYNLIPNWRYKKLFLLIISYAFYAASFPPYVIILWVSTIIDWYAGKGIYSAKTKSKRRAFLALSLFSNLGMLATFKYADFAIQNCNQLFSYINIQLTLPETNILLPVGISYYTFQTLSYSIDIYKGNLKPKYSFLDFALYVTFFPQLVAGPIVRASEFLPQCEEPKRTTAKQLNWGISLFIIGLFTKVVFADAILSPIAQAVYSTPQTHGFISSWTGTLAFSLQIFCDFFGYSTCAIGIALCLGFALPDNFHWPYAAKGFSDFWRRWHITLSTWLRDYLYIPLGGNRISPTKTQINLMITMLLGGIWHGASWMFVIWGTLHGSFLIIESFIKKTKIAKSNLWNSFLGKAAIIITTYLITCFTWVYFRADNLEQANKTCYDMLNLKQASQQIKTIFTAPETLNLPIGLLEIALTLIITAATITIHTLLRNTTTEQAFAKLPWQIRSTLLAIMSYLTAISMTGESSAFIYFRF